MPHAGIVDREIGPLANVGLDAAHNRANRFARRKVLPRAFLLRGVFLQQTFVRLPFQIHVEFRPFRLVNQVDEFLEIDRLAEFRQRACENIAEDAFLLAEFRPTRQGNVRVNSVPDFSRRGDQSYFFGTSTPFSSASFRNSRYVNCSM